jgi:hypothetical protein
VIPQRFKRFAVLLADPTFRLMRCVVGNLHVLNKMFFFLELLVACKALVPASMKQHDELNNFIYMAWTWSF